MPTYLLLLLSFTLTHAQSTEADASEDFDLGLIETTHNLCPLTHDCIPQENCPHFQEDVAKLESLSIESLEYESLVEELKKGISIKDNIYLFIKVNISDYNNYKSASINLSLIAIREVLISRFRSELL